MGTFNRLILTRALPQWLSRKKNLPAMQETQEMQLQFLGLEDPLEKEMATHSSILAWENPKKGGGAGGLQSMGSQKSWVC